MPCYYTGSAEGDRALAAEQSAEKYSNALTEITELLCSTCEKLEKTKNLIHLPTEVKTWWTNHKKVDQKRLSEEKKEKEKKLQHEALLANLTNEEKELLRTRGIH